MIADGDTNVVFVADSLARKFPNVRRDLALILRQHAILLSEVPGTLDVWCRDYLPIQVAEGRFVPFRYEPDYLAGKHRHLRADAGIGPTLVTAGEKTILPQGSCWTMSILTNFARAQAGSLHPMPDGHPEIPWQIRLAVYRSLGSVPLIHTA